jgi:hypothetical protein
MPSVTMPTFRRQRPRRVDDRDNLAIAQRARGDEHRLVLALIEDVAQPRLEPLIVTSCDRDALVGRVVDDDLADVRRDVGRLLALAGRLTSHLLGERERRHESPRSTSSTSMSGVTFMSSGVRNLRLDDLVRAEMVMRVRHYLPRELAVLVRSVMRPMSSIPAWRS